MASGPPVIHFDIDLSELRGECLFTESLLLASLLTQPLASPFTDLVHRCDAIRTEQQILTDAIIRQEALIVECDRDLDKLADEVEAVVRKLAGNDRTLPIYIAFIPRPLNELKRPILGAELVTAETWPEKMKSGPPELAAFYDRTVALIVRCRKALADLQTLEIKLEQLPITGSIKKLVDDTNSTRAKAFGLLGELVHAHPELLLPNDWPGRFFRRTRRRTGTPASLETVMAQIAVLKTKMDALERLRIDLVGHEDVEKRAKADAERHDAETLLASKQKSLDVLQAEIEALKKKTE
jgi:hypothetical protein